MWNSQTITVIDTDYIGRGKSNYLTIVSTELTIMTMISEFNVNQRSLLCVMLD